MSSLKKYDYFLNYLQILFSEKVASSTKTLSKLLKVYKFKLFAFAGYIIAMV